jgi:hypothetical protein
MTTSTFQTQEFEPLSPAELFSLAEQYHAKGYALARGLFSPEEVEEIKTRFMDIQREGIPGVYEPGRPGEAGADPKDPLNQFPRFIHPHKHDAMSFRYMLDPRVGAILETLLGEPALAVQTMFYYKPPGSRGQALHQDQFYLLVEPGTCMAAWTAIDDCDATNGGMMVVPNTDDASVECPTNNADASASFTKHYVAVPKGKKAQLVPMKAGDTLFFNGSLIHGSGPNRTKDRFRRSFIAHYATGDARKIASYYQPAYRMDGTEIGLEINTTGGPCGTAWAGGTH